MSSTGTEGVAEDSSVIEKLAADGDGRTVAGLAPVGVGDRPRALETRPITATTKSKHVTLMARLRQDQSGHSTRR
ncbi:hypothetical protein [Intrasporangium calvum]|uniref:hypothetical protein n=1 Tax=Intrasporangium calvum TaxID=53358 RepID=UPI00123751A0|nr:hypothetical protein [Intrasporangium calvum]